MSERIINSIIELEYALALLKSEYIGHLAAIAEILSNALINNKRIYLFGNGGSAADAQHIAAELVGRFRCERRALPAEALTVNTSVLTALANDYDYSLIFARQIEAYGQQGDVCIGLTTSGNSNNVIRGLAAAKEKGMVTLALTGASGGAVKEIADSSLCLPSDSTPRIQELTILVAHIICDLVEQTIIAKSE